MDTGKTAQCSCQCPQHQPDVPAMQISSSVQEHAKPDAGTCECRAQPQRHCQRDTACGPMRSRLNVSSPNGSPRQRNPCDHVKPSNSQAIRERPKSSHQSSQRSSMRTNKSQPGDDGPAGAAKGWSIYDMPITDMDRQSGIAGTVKGHAQLRLHTHPTVQRSTDPGGSSK